MNAFMDGDFLLRSGTARHLYHSYAANMPLADYHCHLDPREIYEDRRFTDLCQVWLGGRTSDGKLSGDHYKWRLMRAAGVDESYITGDRPPFARFLKLAEALEMAVGNPVYHWCHMELKQYFDVQEPLTVESAGRIWEHCNALLHTDPELTPRGMIRRANVKFIGTTDDPVDTLFWHRKIAEDPDISVRVFPSFRPDRALNIHKPGWTDYMRQLAASVGKDSLDTVDDVLWALLQRLDRFCEQGCRASDHGLDTVPYQDAAPAQADAVFQKALRGHALTEEEIQGYQTVLLRCLGEAYHERNIVMQLHYSCLRNNNRRIFGLLGPDAGADAIARTACGGNVARLLDDLDGAGKCPKTVLYSLDPTDNAQLDSLIGCFQDSSIPGKLQHGAAWWFNDHKAGITEQLTSLAALGVLGNFIGMLTDSRSFLSYARHDYFRRILCDLIGGWVESGEYPNREESLKKLTEGICYRNAARYFAME